VGYGFILKISQKGKKRMIRDAGKILPDLSSQV
jgi:hypothetical protein